MKKFKIIFYYLFAGITQLIGHGFNENSYVKMADGYSECIEQLCNFSNDEQIVLSYDLINKNYISQKIKSYGKATTNCYFILSINKNYTEDILCTPSQEFYLPKTNEWIPAYRLQVGDTLLSINNQLKQIKNKKFVKKELNVYSIELENIHNFFVGNASVLTHNMCLPLLQFGIGAAFGSGATAGGSAGSFFGPIGITGGIVIGGIFAVAVHSFWGNKVKEYSLSFNPDSFKNYLQNDMPQNNQTNLPNNNQPNNGSNIDPSNKNNQNNSSRSTQTSLKRRVIMNTKNGLKIVGFTKHAIDRAIGGYKRLGVKPNAIIDALRNPLKIKEIQKDSLGRFAQRFIGKLAEVVVNPESGLIVSMNATKSAKAVRIINQLKNTL